MPDKKKTALTLRDELSGALSALPDEKQEEILSLFRQMRPAAEDYGEMKDVRWRPTIISVKQPTTRKAPDSAQNGDLYSSDTGRVYERPLRIVPIYPYTNRARFQPMAMRPDCRSEDEKISIYGDNCDECADKPWRDGKRQKCQRTVNIIATTPEFSKIFRLQFRGASFKQGVAMVKQAISDGERLHERIYTLDTKKEEGAQGVYYTMVVNYAGAVDKDYVPVGQAMYDELKRQREELLAQIRKNISEGQSRAEMISDDIGGELDEEPADFSDL